jgi:phage-related protein
LEAIKIKERVDKIRTIKLYKTYFKDFYVAQTDDVRKKINYVLKLVESLPIIPERFFRAIEGTDGLYEIRVEVNGNIYRIFCCMDNGSLVVLFNSFQKKTQKTPKKEIDKGVAIMKQYFKEKENK